MKNFWCQQVSFHQKWCHVILGLDYTFGEMRGPLRRTRNVQLWYSQDSMFFLFQSVKCIGFIFCLIISHWSYQLCGFYYLNAQWIINYDECSSVVESYMIMLYNIRKMLILHDPYYCRICYYRMAYFPMLLLILVIITQEFINKLRIPS